MSHPYEKPNDLTFDALMEEAKRLIPKYSNSWTNFNPSDPGITLVELMAWVCETMAFRLDQTEPELLQQVLAFIGLEPELGESTEALHARASMHLQKQHRMVTQGDYAALAKEAMLALDSNLGGKVLVVPNRNLQLINPIEERLGHVSIILLPEKGIPQLSDDTGQPTSLLLQQVSEALEPARLLTHRLHVVGPKYRLVGVRAWVSVETGADFRQVEEQARDLINQMTDPLNGEKGQGWPLGRGIYLSEIYEALGRVQGIENIHKVQFNQNSSYIPIEPYKFLQLILELQQSY